MKLDVELDYIALIAGMDGDWYIPPIPDQDKDEVETNVDELA